MKAVAELARQQAELAARHRASMQLGYGACRSLALMDRTSTSGSMGTCQARMSVSAACSA